MWVIEDPAVIYVEECFGRWILNYWTTREVPQARPEKL